jgi:hypothetical protein
VPLGNYEALSIQLLRFIWLETYCSYDDKIQNSGQNRKTFDKNVLRCLDNRYLDQRMVLSKIAQVPGNVQLKRPAATAKIQRDVGLL